MLHAIAGTYRDGAVQLDEAPAGIRQARVVVTFLTQVEFDDSKKVLLNAVLGNRFHAPGQYSSTLEPDPVAKALAELRQERSSRLPEAPTVS